MQHKKFRQQPLGRTTTCVEVKTSQLVLVSRWQARNKMPHLENQVQNRSQAPTKATQCEPDNIIPFSVPHDCEQIEQIAYAFGIFSFTKLTLCGTY